MTHTLTLQITDDQLAYLVNALLYANAQTERQMYTHVDDHLYERYRDVHENFTKVSVLVSSALAEQHPEIYHLIISSLYGYEL